LDFSKLKLEVYDFLGVILPGLLVVCEAWVLLRGWTRFISSASRISGPALTILIVFAFGVGHIVQELGDVAIKSIKGKRYFKRARDHFWKTEEAGLIKDAIRTERGRDIASADIAFDYCLTKVVGQFAKRDMFMATSDLCRSFVVLAFIGLIPAARIAFRDITPWCRSLEVFAILLVLLTVVASLAWKRMMRFRELADVTVFHVYLAARNELE
jgi:hypothetical protein